MNNLVLIKRILAERSDHLTMEQRQSELSNMIEKHGIDDVSVAAGLKVSTINQYLRDKCPRISLGAIEQARYVFTHPQYKNDKN